MHSKYKNIAKTFHYSGNRNDDTSSKYKIDSFDNPNGWSFNQIEHLHDMGFEMEDDYTFSTKVDKYDVSDDEGSFNISVYKDNNGYVLDFNRKYIFKTFDDMIQFIENSKPDFNFN